MKVSKTEYLKQCWDYTTSSLKYLKDLSGNSIGIKERSITYANVSELLRKMSTIDELDLVEGCFYKSKKYSEYDMTGKYIGYYTVDEKLVSRFEVLSSEAKIGYEEPTDIIEFSLSDLAGSRSFEFIEIKKEDLPLHLSKPFQGKLLQKMLKECDK